MIASLWPRIESELDHEIGVKDREVDWLCKIGSDIQSRLTEDQQPGMLLQEHLYIIQVKCQLQFKELQKNLKNKEILSQSVLDELEESPEGLTKVKNVNEGYKLSQYI